MASSWKITDGPVKVFVGSSPHPEGGTLLTGTVLSMDSGGFYLQETSGATWYCAWPNLYWVQKIGP